MKRILLLLIAVWNIGIGFGQVFNVSGGGTFPTGWSSTNNVTAQAIDKGTYYLVEAGSPSDIITTASYDLSAFASAEFTLDVASYGGGTHREATIEFSFDGGATYTQTETSTTTTGSSYISGGTFTLSSVTNQVVIRITNSGTSGRGVRLRDLVLTGSGVGSTDTEVELSLASYNVSESGTSIQICADIINESASVATTVDLVLTSAATPHISSYSTQTLTFPAGSSTQECVSITITDNATCDGNEVYDFELQSIAGGTSAAIGSQNSTQLIVSDDEMTSGNLLFQSFEGAGTWAYTLSTPDCNISGDVWSIESNLSSIDPASDGVNFWGIRDLNGNCGGSGYETISFASTNISGTNNVVISFDYKTQGFDAGDNLGYEIWENGTKVVDLVNLLDNTVPNWETVTYNVTSGVNDVYLVLKAKQNGGSDYAGFDNVIISGDVCAAACSEPTSDAVFHINSPQSLTETSATLNFTVGDGDNRIVVMKESSTIGFSPIDNTTYNSNNSFGLGTDVGTGEFVVYNGALNSVSVTGLTPGTEYYSTIFEYSCLAGAEDYFITGTPATDVFLTVPENPATFIEGCTGSTTLDLSWTAPNAGNFDGYLLVVRQGSSPHAVTSLDPSTQTYDLDYSLAPTYGTGGGSSVLYNGTGTSASITGLTNGLSYTFEVLTYTIGTSEYKYSTGTTTSQTIELEDVSGATVNTGNTQLDLVWVNPLIACFDEVLVVINETPGISFSPTGNGSTYSANPVYASVDQVVYQGSGAFETITSLTNGTTYYFEIFVRNGTNWSSGIEVSGEPTTATILEQGDLAIVAINTSAFASGSDDEVCFFAFKDITIGTAIDFTDNGYERLTAGTWADSEGTIRLEKTSGATIPAGTVICFQGSGNSSTDFDVFVCGSNDNANWVISSLNGALYSYDLNTNDQIWILQGGSWSNPSGSHNALYTGNIIYGWTAIGWEPAPGYNDTKGSTLPEGTDCINTDLTGITAPDKGKYTGPLTITTQRGWLERINNVANWTGFADNSAYNSGAPDYSGSCITLPITTSGFSPGYWEGDVDDQWFNCSNWQNLKVPDASVNVTIQTGATNDAVIDYTHTSAGFYNNIAECNNLQIEDSRSVALEDGLDVLHVYGNLDLQEAGTGSALYNNDAATIFIDSNLTIETASLLDMHNTSGTDLSVLNLGGDWTDNNTTDNFTQGFDERNSLVVLTGINNQTLSDASGKETFNELQLNKSSQTELILNDDIEVSEKLEFGSGGIITTGVNEVYLNSTLTTTLVGVESTNATGVYSDDSYVKGNFAREVAAGNTYLFPVGDEVSGLGYNPITLEVLTGSTGKVIGYFDASNPGSILVTNSSLTCAGVPVLIDYNTMTGQGFWNLESNETYNYNVLLSPNTANTNNAPNTDGQYRALKAASGTAGGTWPSSSAIDGDYCVVSSNYYSIPGNNYTGFSDFAVGGGVNGPALPVELLFFQAESQQENVLVSWATVTEINNDFFTIERSVNGEDFKAIGAISGAGNYAGKLDYQFKDSDPLEGVSYYRLKQTDFDGSFEYSEIRVVDRNSIQIEVVKLFPNPVSDNLNFSYYNESNETISISVLDVLGKVVFKNENIVINNKELLSIDVQSLTQGTYTLYIQTATRSISKLFVKE